MPMLVKDVMNPKVVIAKPEADAKEAAVIMTKFKIGCLVILSEDKIVGIVTEGDMIRKVLAQGRNGEEVRLEEIMTKDTKTIEADKEISEAAEMMVENKIKRLPVVDKGKLVGIITSTDLISYEPKMIEALGELFMLKTQRQVAG